MRKEKHLVGGIVKKTYKWKCNNQIEPMFHSWMVFCNKKNDIMPCFNGKIQKYLGSFKIIIMYSKIKNTSRYCIAFVTNVVPKAERITHTHQRLEHSMHCWWWKEGKMFDVQKINDLTIQFFTQIWMVEIMFHLTLIN